MGLVAPGEEESKGETDEDGKEESEGKEKLESDKQAEARQATSVMTCWVPSSALM